MLGGRTDNGVGPGQESRQDRGLAVSEFSK